MAKAKNAATADVSVEFLNSLTELHKKSQRLDLSKFGGQVRAGAAGSASAAKGVNVCAIYAKVKPYLEIIVRIPFIPVKVREALKLLMGALDTMCPVR